MPSPRTNETKKDWVNRCMSDSEQKKTFPDRKQRLAVCYKKWEEHIKASKEEEMSN